MKGYEEFKKKLPGLGATGMQEGREAEGGMLLT